MICRKLPQRVKLFCISFDGCLAKTASSVASSIRSWDQNINFPERLTLAHSPFHSDFLLSSYSDYSAM